MTEDVMGEAADAYAPELVTPVVVYLAHEETYTFTPSQR